MAKPNTQPDEVLLTNESPLAKAEAQTYVEQQKEADWNRNMSQYMFWGATSVMLAIAGVAFNMAAPIAALGYIGTMAAGGVLSALTFVGSVFFSRKATDISERSNVLYSDIDSQNQARRMVQSFARAQTQGTSASREDKDSTPFTATAPSSEKSWVSRTAKPEATAGSWQERVAAQADREDALALSQLRG